MNQDDLIIRIGREPTSIESGLRRALEMREVMDTLAETLYSRSPADTKPKLTWLVLTESDRDAWRVAVVERLRRKIGEETEEDPDPDGGIPLPAGEFNLQIAA